MNTPNSPSFSPSISPDTSPDTSPTFNQLRRILLRDYPLDPGVITPVAALDSLGIDSLGVAELLFNIEDEFKISVPAEPVQQVQRRRPWEWGRRPVQHPRPAQGNPDASPIAASSSPSGPPTRLTTLGVRASAEFARRA